MSSHSAPAFHRKQKGKKIQAAESVDQCGSRKQVACQVRVFEFYPPFCGVMECVSRERRAEVR